MTIQKTCFKCGKKKDLEQFYKHPEMADGHLGKCKSCTKEDVRSRYYDSRFRPKIIEYEKQRFKDPKRKASIKRYRRKMALKSPGKQRARWKFNRAVRDGKLKKLPCEVCGSEKSQGHHEDYRKPLDVKWFCRRHHMEHEGKQSYL